MMLYDHAGGGAAYNLLIFHRVSYQWHYSTETAQKTCCGIVSSTWLSHDLSVVVARVGAEGSHHIAAQHASP